MKYLLAHDLGTSGDKATLFTEEGKQLASGTRSYPLFQEREEYAEQDGNDWWQAFCETTKELILGSGVSPEDIEALSFSGQMLGLLPVDLKGEPLRRSLIWADLRAVAEAEELRSKISDEEFYAIVGHRNTASYSLQKAMWLKKHEPENYERARCFLNAKDYIVLKLTGRLVTDPSDANSTGAFDLKKRCWSERILQAAGIDGAKFPEIVDSTAVVGTVSAEAAARTGLSTRTKVVMGAGDGVAANVGAGSVSPGSAYLCLGTSAWVATTAKAPLFDDRMRSVTWAHAVPGLYSPNATMQYACGSYDWFKEVIGTGEQLISEKTGEDVYVLLTEEARLSPPGANGLIFLPHLLGERAPRWNEQVRGAFFGISGKTTRSDLVRSVLEGIAMNLSLCLSAIDPGKEIREIRAIGGGAKNDLWMQIFADLFGIPVTVPENTRDANSMGAAILAGVGAGIFPDFSAVSRFIREKKRILPDPERVRTYRELLPRYERAYQAAAFFAEG